MVFISKGMGMYLKLYLKISMGLACRAGKIRNRDFGFFFLN